MEMIGELQVPPVPPVKEILSPFSGRLCGPRSRLDCLESRRISCPCRDWNPQSSSLESSYCTYRLRYSGSVRWPHKFSVASPFVFCWLHMTCWANTLYEVSAWRNYFLHSVRRAQGHRVRYKRSQCASVTGGVSARIWIQFSLQPRHTFVGQFS